MIDPMSKAQEPAMGEASSQPDHTPAPHRRRAGRASLLTPPLGIPLFSSRPQRPADELPLPAQPPADDRPPVPPRPDEGLADKMCRCGHGRTAHEHYRRGSDCGVCGATGCAAFRRPSILRAIVMRIRRAS
jgi:hypothetical protein